jgi:excisionase family DNA binding protein
MEKVKEFGEMFYSSAEIAQKLGVSVRHVRQLCQEGKIKAKKFGRDWWITESSYRNYLSSRK